MKKIILSLICALTLSFAIEKENIKTEMTTNIKFTLNKIKEKNINEIIPILDSVLDYKTMSQIALGNKWKELSEEEKILFISAFEKKLKNSYLDKLNLYTNQKVEIKELKQPKQNRIELETEIISETDKYSMVYKFFEKNNDWKIYDIDLLGVSIIQTYRKQFQGYFKLPENNIHTLISELNKNI
jgi:phospholipid transport system substrate-binding protein